MGGRPWGIGQRLVALITAALALSLLVAGAAAYTWQRSTVLEQLDAELLQEVEELRQRSQQANADGRPYRDVGVLLEDFLRFNVPGEDEMMGAFVGDARSPSLVSGGDRTVDLTEPQVVAAVLAERRAGEVVLRTVETDAENLRLAITSVAGFVLIATLFAVAGALASRVEDVQSTATPVTMLIMAVFFSGMLATGTVASVLSWVPPFSAVLIPMRLVTGQAQWWQALVANAQVQDEVQVAGTGPIALGSFSYSADSTDGATLTVPQVVVGRRGDRAWVTTMGVGAAPETPQLDASPPEQPIGIRFADQPVKAELLTYEHVAEDRIMVSFSVTMKPGTEAECAVQAMNEGRAQVGFVEVHVPAQEQRRSSHQVEIATQGEAVSAEVPGCEPR